LKSKSTLNDSRESHYKKKLIFSMDKICM